MQVLSRFSVSKTIKHILIRLSFVRIELLWDNTGTGPKQQLNFCRETVLTP